MRATSEFTEFLKFIETEIKAKFKTPVNCSPASGQTVQLDGVYGQKGSAQLVRLRLHNVQIKTKIPDGGSNFQHRAITIELFATGRTVDILSDWRWLDLRARLLPVWYYQAGMEPAEPLEKF